jgi:Protein of unknown function (DUF1552)
MIVAKKAIPRRTVLRGLGSVLALPLLDSMVPALTALQKTPARPINRFSVLYVPNGMIMKDYLPLTEGAAYELTPTLRALAPFRQHVLVLSGLECVPTPGRPGGAHAKASTRFLTDVSPPTSETWLDAGISMDQILAQEMGKQTQVASLELAIESSETTGACDTGFACPYTNTISWRSQNTPLPTQNNPRVIFERLFGDSTSTDPQARLARLRHRRSVLDSVSDEIAQLHGALPPSDRTKLTEYLEAIRDVEQRIQIAEAQSDRELPLVENPAGIPAGWEDHVNLMFDLQVLAFQCDLTRVITLMLGHEHSGMTYPQIGVPDAHHPISHHQQEPDKVAKVAKINAYHMQTFAKLLAKLQATADGDGTLLDHVTMMYGAGMADSNSHSPIDIPLILAGGGGGQLKGGRHIRFKNMPLANLHLTLLDQFGVHWDRIGDSTGRVDAGLLAL